MHTRWLMGTSAALMALLGLIASFLPQELLIAVGSHPDGFVVTAVRLGGSLYLGFAMLNWMARGILIGGIYARPVALGNFLHFAVGASTLFSALGYQRSALTLVCLLAYAGFAVWFGVVLFKPPVER